MPVACTVVRESLKTLRPRYRWSHSLRTRCLPLLTTAQRELQVQRNVPAIAPQQRVRRLQPPSVLGERACDGVKRNVSSRDRHYSLVPPTSLVHSTHRAALRIAPVNREPREWARPQPESTRPIRNGSHACDATQHHARMSAQERARTGLPAHVVHERHPLRHEWKQHSGDMREGRWSHTEAIGAKPASRNCHAAAATATMLVEATPCACESPCTARQGGKQEGGGACAQLSMARDRKFDMGERAPFRRRCRRGRTRREL